MKFPGTQLTKEPLRQTILPGHSTFPRLVFTSYQKRSRKSLLNILFYVPSITYGIKTISTRDLRPCNNAIWSRGHREAAETWKLQILYNSVETNYKVSQTLFCYISPRDKLLVVLLKHNVLSRLNPELWRKSLSFCLREVPAANVTTLEEICLGQELLIQPIFEKRCFLWSFKSWRLTNYSANCSLCLL